MRYYLPAAHADAWQQLLANPQKHWRISYSARTLAHCWHAAEGFPPEVALALNQSRQVALHNLEPLLGLPEHQVPLPGGRPSQTDLWVLARGHAGLVSIAIEGKVNESFGPTLATWLRHASSGKQQRLTMLTNLLGLPAVLPETIRYQLLHRTVSAVIEAQRFGAHHAVMLVHSFSVTHAGFDDFAAFAALFGATAAPDQIVSVGSRAGVDLSLGWICGDVRFGET